MKYIANPVIVDAFVIKEIILKNVYGAACIVTLENEEKKEATPEMLSRINLKVGDYWVVQSDGYEYLNPKDVFERKYKLLGADNA